MSTTTTTTKWSCWRPLRRARTTWCVLPAEAPPASGAHRAAGHAVGGASVGRTSSARCACDLRQFAHERPAFEAMLEWKRARARELGFNEFALRDSNPGRSPGLARD